MTSFSASYISITGFLLLVLTVVYGEDPVKWEVHGSQQRINGQGSEKLGGSIADQRNSFALDGMRAGDYQKGHVEYERQLFTDGTRSLNGNVGLTADNMGNRAKNFGVRYEDPKNSASWNRQLSGPVRADTYRAERNFFSTPDGNAKIGAYAQHERNNFGFRNTEGGIYGRYNFGG